MKKSKGIKTEQLMWVSITLTSLSLLANWPFWLTLPIGVMTICVSLQTIKESQGNIAR